MRLGICSTEPSWLSCCLSCAILHAGVNLLAMCAQVELPKLQAAISIACRLGFATRLPNPYEGAPLSCSASLEALPALHSPKDEAFETLAYFASWPVNLRLP